jgi:glutathione S-transferase
VERGTLDDHAVASVIDTARLAHHELAARRDRPNRLFVLAMSYHAPMKLLGNALSPYATRVIIAARYKAIELTLVAPQAEPALRIQNPIGKVPVLVDAALILPESDVIVNYLEDRVPLPTLFPGGAVERANIRLLTRLLDTYSAPSFGPFIGKPDPVAIATALERIDTALGYIDHFRNDGEFASGDAFSAADCALIPFFHAFELLQGGFNTYDLVKKRPRLDAWWSRARTSELGSFARDAMNRAFAEFAARRSS